MTYLGSVASDRADYPRAVALLEGAIRASHAVGEPRREAYGLSMLGRVGLLRGDLDAADEHLGAAVELAEAEHWLSFLPWPQALSGHVLLARGDLDGAATCLEQSFARACQIGDPCWEGISARGLALLAEAKGEPDRALADLLDARSRTNRLADPYVWLDVHILDALCEMGCRHGHPLTASWVEEMHERASRAGMQELTVRAMLHGARLGSAGDAEAAVLLGAQHRQPAPRAGAGGRSAEHALLHRAVLGDAGGPDRRGLLTLDAIAAEGIDRLVALPALVDVDPGAGPRGRHRSRSRGSRLYGAPARRPRDSTSRYASRSSGSTIRCPATMTMPMVTMRCQTGFRPRTHRAVRFPWR